MRVVIFKEELLTDFDVYFFRYEWSNRRVPGIDHGVLTLVSGESRFSRSTYEGTLRWRSSGERPFAGPV